MKKDTTNNHSNSNYGIKGKSLFFEAYGKDAIRLGSALHILESYRLEGSAAQYIKVKFRDQSGKKIVVDVARGDLWQPGLVIKQLLGAGWQAANVPDLAKHVANYLLGDGPTDIVTLTPRLAWFGNTHLWPEAPVTYKGETFRFNAGPNSHPMDINCSQSEIGHWAYEVLRPCSHSHVLVFSLCASFAGLVRRSLSDIQGGGFHLWGGSSKGKTTTLLAAQSTIGKPKRTGLFTWNATPTAREETAIQHADLLLCIDETGTLAGQSKGKAAEAMLNAIFGLSGQRGKARSVHYKPATKEAIGHQVDAPDVLYLSTGEQPVGKIIGDDGKALLPGGEVRLIDIPIDRIGTPWGIFHSMSNDYAEMDVPEEEKARLLAQEVEEGVSDCYGIAGRALTAYVTKYPKKAKRQFLEHLADFQAIETPYDGAQERRKKERFALVYAGGMLAHDAGIMYDQDAIYHAVLWAYKASMSDTQVAPPSLADDMGLLKTHMQKIVTTSGLGISEMLASLGGFIDPRSKYAGFVLMRTEALASLLNAKTRVTRMIDALEAKGFLAGKDQAGAARTVIYKVTETGERLRVLGIDMNVLN